MIQGSQDIGARAEAPAPHYTLSAHIEGLDKEIGRAQEHLKMLRCMADQLSGPRPQPIGNDSGVAKSEPVSHLARLSNRRATLSNTLDAISEEIVRISDAL